MATMKDVANLAGVGVGTVSRYVNNPDSLKESTKVKVEYAINKLDYQPNEYARGLKLNKTNSVALIIPSIWHPFFSEFAYYVERTLENYGYKLLLCNSENNYKKESEYIKMVQQNKVDGIIGITYSDIDKYVKSNMPFVSIDRHFKEDVTYVTSDNEQAGRLAATQLIKNGCKSLAYIGGIPVYKSEITKRASSFLKEAKEQKIKFSSLEIPEPIDKWEEKIEEFILSHPDIDGIFTINDYMGLDVKQCLENLGKKVPDDIQIIGCDGIKLSKDRQVIMSTIKQPVEEMAIKSVQSLLKIINHLPVEKRIVLPVTYIQGKTTK